MSDDKNPRIQHMVPNPDSTLTHGLEPVNYVKPPKPPKPVPNSGIGNANE
jgi:hypothetical protein